MKLKDLLNNETFISKYGDYETVGNSYTAVRENDKLQLVFDIQEPKPKTVWELEKGDKCFILYDDGDIAEYKWSRNTGLAESYRDQGNVFLTYEDAVAERERREVETLLIKYGGRRWFKMDNICNYYMWVDARDSLVVGCTGVGMQNLIYFDTRKQAEKALSEIGEERIKGALFEVR